jgi:hypothetical protein
MSGGLGGTLDSLSERCCCCWAAADVGAVWLDGLLREEGFCGAPDEVVF